MDAGKGAAKQMAMSKQQQQVMNDLLIEAVQRRDVAQAKLYLQKGADVNLKLNVSEPTFIGNVTSYSTVSAPLIHLAAADRYFQAEMVDLLLGAGADINAKSSTGNTPLMLAVQAANAGRVKFYLARGADPLATNQAGQMVLQEAQRLPQAQEKRQEIINALLSKIDDQNSATSAQSLQTNKQDVTVPQGKIEVMKPVTIGQKPKPSGNTGGFNL